MAGKVEPTTHSRVAVSLGEPMLECNIEWVPLWEDNRSEDMMVPSWRDPGLFPMEDIALAVGHSAFGGALLCQQKCV